MQTFLTGASELARGLVKESLYILPYLFAGVLLEATIRTFKWHVKLRHVLGSFGPLTILVATLLGVASPLCACATLPLVISLLVAGLPLAPAMSLMVTSPIMSPGAYAMLGGMLGFGWANVILFCAVFLGLLAGYAAQLLRPYGFSEDKIFRRQLPAGNFHDPDYPVEELRCDCGRQLSHRLAKCDHNPFVLFLAKFWEGAVRIGKFALIGLVIEVVVDLFVPREWVVNLLTGESVWPIFTVALATIPLHLPQVTAASMIFAYFMPEPGTLIPLAKGPGIAMLVGGPVTALPVMGVLLSMFRLRVFLLYLAVCVGGTLFLALGYHYLPVTF